ncbi:hypothetical protein MauCBS54593_003349 [Microsporum audouinii]
MFLIVVGISLLSLIYWCILPRPLPGIPYNTKSAKSILGDIPRALSHYNKTKEVASFVFEQCRGLKSPIIQVFLRPFNNPTIILDDPREIEDILLRRTREFDRAPSTIKLLKPLVPHATLVKPSNQDFKRQRRLWQDIMLPDFLRSVVAPKIYKSAHELIELWRLKANLAAGHAFHVEEDLGLAAFDIIWEAMLGSQLHGVRVEIDHLQHHSSSIDLPDTTQFPVQFPASPRAMIYKAIDYANRSLEAVMKSPLPFIHLWYIRQTPRFRYYNGFKNRHIGRLIEQSRGRFKKLSALSEEETKYLDTCAMDLVLRREELSAKKTGTAPPPDANLAMRDELAMFLVAGHETTATTLSWSVKLLSQNQREQHRLRKALQFAFNNTDSRYPPSVQDILTANIPYLDGSLEEILRLSNTVPLLVRVATVDTEVLGYKIPKGTHVLCNSQFTAGPYDVPENSRSPTSQMAMERSGTRFAKEDIYRYKPERWIRKDDIGNEIFNPHALTRHAFSLGPRGCFGDLNLVLFTFSIHMGLMWVLMPNSFENIGKRLAIQELRVVLTLLVLNFQFMPVPDELDSFGGLQKILRHPQQCYVKLVVI